MSIKKPSEFFNRERQEDNLFVEDQIEEINSDTPIFSEAVNSFKDNLQKFDLLSEKIDDYKSNTEKIDEIAKKVEDLQSQVKSILRKENLDIKTLSQLSFVAEDIDNVQNQVGGLKKPSEYFSVEDLREQEETIQEFSETFTYYSRNLQQVNYLSEQVEELREEIKNVLKKEDLERTMMSQLVVVEQSISDLQNKVKDINESNFLEINSRLFDLTELVNNFAEIEIPQYKKDAIQSKIQTDEKLIEFKDELNDVRQKTSQIIKHLKENKILKKVNNLQVEIIRNESLLKSQNKNIQHIQENLLSALDNLDIAALEKRGYELSKKIKYIEEVFEKFDEQKLISENLVTEPPSTKNTDPLTPLDQKYVTLEQLQEHYRLFINRIQQQLSTLGGGGETRLKYLDDVVGIATNPAAYDNKFLKYKHAQNKFEFSSITGADVSMRLQDLLDVDPTGLDQDYLMIWNNSLSQFVFVDPKTYFGINDDSNPAPDIDDFGSY